jgi:pimeloyl-ACP methyl ester carboxylesterase
MNSIQYKNSNIYYDYFNASSESSTFVLIHGFGLDHRIWMPQVDFLKNKDLNFLAYDMRGFGKSDSPSLPYSHRDDLRELLGELGIEKAVLVGMSFGGEVAINFALENVAMVEKVLLLGTSLGGYQGKDDKLMKSWTKLAQDGKLETVKMRMLQHPSLTNLEGDGRELVEKILMDYSGWHFVNDDPQERLKPPAIDRLKEVEVPTKVVVGMKDNQNQIDIAHKISKEVENAELFKLDAGHFLNLEKNLDIARWI